MIVTCPECDARFMLNAAVLAPAGRKVRCTKCEHVWLQQPDEEDLAPPADSVFDDRDLEPAEDLAQGDAPADAPMAEETAMGEDESGMEPIPDDIKPIVKSAAPVLEGEGMQTARYFWVSFIVFALIGLLALLPLRSRIVHAWEPANTFYKVVGMGIPPAGKGLAFEGLKASEHKTQEGTVLLIEGRIANNTESGIEVPALKTSLLGLGEVLHEKVLKGEKKQVLPAQTSVKFQTTVGNPPSGAISARLSVASLEDLANHEPGKEAGENQETQDDRL